MDIQKLGYLILGYEGPKLDFKEMFSLEQDFEKKEFARDVCAIANSKGGRGYIIYGISDDKEIVGVPKNIVSEEKIQQIVTSRIDPPVEIRVEELAYCGKNLIVVTIFSSEGKPHQMKHNGSFYIRRGSTTDIARREEIASLMQEYGMISHETTMLGNVDMKMLNQELIDRYLKSFHELEGENQSLLLESLGFIKRDYKNERYHYHPTIMGMLLFGYKVQTFLPHTGIKIYFQNKMYEITGTILEMLDASYAVCKDILNETPDFLKGLDLVIANALVHRDYLDQQRQIRVQIFDDRIEVLNPGAVSSTTRVDKESDTNLLTRRNPVLFERLTLLDNKQRYLRNGMGIKLIKGLFRGKEVKFINILKTNTFKVIIQR